MKITKFIWLKFLILTTPEFSRGSKLKARDSKINLFVPAAKLVCGDYVVKLSALTELSGKSDFLSFLNCGKIRLELYA